jgi:hypothetical protein
MIYKPPHIDMSEVGPQPPRPINTIVECDDDLAYDLKPTGSNDGETISDPRRIIAIQSIAEN